MKKRIVMLCLFVGMLLCQPLLSQGLKIGIEGQGAFPSGDFNDTAGAGWGASALLVVNLGGFGITGNVGYLAFGDQDVNVGDGQAKLSTNAIPVLGGLRLYLGGGVGPKFHIGGQAGFHRFNVDLKDIPDSVGNLDPNRSDTEFSIGPVVGIEAGSLDLSATYMIIKDANYVGLRLGFALINF